jgi:DNA-binding CsgD family transcriptional regulator
MLVPHFARSVELHARLRLTEAERSVLASSFEHLRVGTIILDELGNVLSINDTARDLLTPRSWIVTLEDPLVVPDRATDAELQKQIRCALGARPDQPFIRALTVNSRANCSALRLLIKSIPRTSSAETQRRPAVALFLRDVRERLAPPAEILQMLFDLTPAEARFARLIASGASLEHAGRRLGITRNTCKSRLRSIFEKTGATRQAALVGVLQDTLVWL